jgi:hypothetical protein
MSTYAVVPSRRSALDEGSLHDLCLDCAQMSLPQQAEPAGPSSPRVVPDVVVPDDVRHLLDDLPPYGT